jgi:hypothetical protein
MDVYVSLAKEIKSVVFCVDYYEIQVKFQYRTYLEQTCYLSSGDPGFKRRAGNRPFWFPESPGQMSGSYLKLGHGCFLPPRR